MRGLCEELCVRRDFRDARRRLRRRHHKRDSDSQRTLLRLFGFRLLLTAGIESSVDVLTITMVDGKLVYLLLYHKIKITEIILTIIYVMHIIMA